MEGSFWTNVDKFVRLLSLVICSVVVLVLITAYVYRGLNAECPECEAVRQRNIGMPEQVIETSETQQQQQQQSVTKHQSWSVLYQSVRNKASSTPSRPPSSLEVDTDMAAPSAVMSGGDGGGGGGGGGEQDQQDATDADLDEWCEE